MLLLLSLSEFNLNQWRKQPLPCRDLFMALHRYYSTPSKKWSHPFSTRGAVGQVKYSDADAAFRAEPLSWTLKAMMAAFVCCSFFWP